MLIIMKRSEPLLLVVTHSVNRRMKPVRGCRRRCERNTGWYQARPRVQERGRPSRVSRDVYVHWHLDQNRMPDALNLRGRS